MQLIYDYKYLNYVLFGHVGFSVSCKAANLCIIPLNSSGYNSNTKVDPEGFLALYQSLSMSVRHVLKMF